MTIGRCLCKVIPFAESSAQAIRRTTLSTCHHAIRHRSTSTLPNPVTPRQPFVQVDALPLQYPTIPSRKHLAKPKKIPPIDHFEEQMENLRIAVLSKDVDSAIKYGLRCAKHISVGHGSVISRYDHDVISSKATIGKVSKARSAELFQVYLDALPEVGGPMIRGLIEGMEDTSVVYTPTLMEIARLALQHHGDYLLALSRLVQLPTINPDGVLIAQVMPTLISRQIPSELLHKLVMEEFERDPEGVHAWPIGLWDLVIGSCGDFELARSLLAVAQTSHAMTLDLEEQLSATRALALSRPFSAAMSVWIKTCNTKSVRYRFETTAPREIARDLSLLIGEKWLPTKFLNTWLNAERVTMNYRAADVIWRLFDIKPIGLVHMVQQAMGDYLTVPVRPRPDVTSWKSYFKLHKSLPSFTTTRQGVRGMLQTISMDKLSTELLDSVLSTIAKETTREEIDLPLLLLVLRLYEWESTGKMGPAPSNRTIDIAAGGLVRLWRRRGAILDPLFISSHARQTREEARQWVAGSDTSRLALHPAEWGLVASTLQDMVPIHRDDTAPPVVEMPLGGSGFTADGSGRLARRNARKTGASGEKGKEKLKVEYDDMPLQLIRPMLALVTRAIRLSLAEQAQNDEELEEMFGKIIGKVYEEVLPKKNQVLELRYNKKGEAYMVAPEAEDAEM